LQFVSTWGILTLVNSASKTQKIQITKGNTKYLIKGNVSPTLLTYFTTQKATITVKTSNPTSSFHVNDFQTSKAQQIQRNLLNFAYVFKMVHKSLSK
jgi:hypothetical protein